MDLEPTELAQAVAAIRQGLLQAQREGSGSQIPLVVREVVLEMDIELRHTVSGGGGIKAYVVNVEGKGERAQTRGHRLTVRLGAEDLQGRDARVGDHRPGLSPLPSARPGLQG
ncbi:trypco2 family protein [Streptacidiphilus sp. PAMC 29251]